MKIGGSNQFGNYGTSTRLLDTGTVDPTAQDDTSTGDAMMNLASSPSQDDAVQISPQSYAATSAADVDSGDVDRDDDATGTSTSTSTSTDSTAEANSHPVKSLVCGALGLDRPDEPTDPNHAYLAGQWIAAGITLGGIISLFV